MRDSVPLLHPPRTAVGSAARPRSSTLRVSPPPFRGNVTGDEGWESITRTSCSKNTEKSCSRLRRGGEVEERVQAGLTLQYAIDCITGDSTWEVHGTRAVCGHMTVQPLNPSRKMTNSPFDAVRERLLRRWTTTQVKDDFALWGSEGTTTTLFCLALQARLEFAGAAMDCTRTPLASVPSMHRAKFSLYAVSEYGDKECEVIVHGEFQKECEFQWQSPKGNVRVVVYIGM